MSQPTLFEEEPAYCIDTNVIIAFLVESDDELYGRDVFGPQWDYIEGLIASGRIVAPQRVEKELEKWTLQSQEIHRWVRAHRRMFRQIVSGEQLFKAKEIVNSYPVYGGSMNYLGDLEVMTLAHALGVPVVTLEREVPTHLQTSRRRPKIPNICREFGIECVSISGLLRREGFGGLPQAH